MTPTMLRQFWSLIEATQSHLLLQLDDSSLVDWLLDRLIYEQSLNYQQTDLFRNYISAKISLIRDLAQQ